MKLSKKDAKELLNNLSLPVSSNRATVLAFDTKQARQAILRNPEHDDRHTAAAIEIQRIYRGYTTRCNLYDLRHGGISNENQGPQSSYMWSDVSVKSSPPQSDEIVCRPPFLSPDINAQLLSDLPKSSSRVKLEEDYCKFREEHASVLFEDYCALVIQSWWRQVCKERRSIRVPSVRPPTMADSYSTTTRLSRPATKMTRQPLTRQGAARIIQRTWRKHVDMQVYCYYKDLISFKFRGDPALLLRCINPREAELLDSGSGTHVKFRLAGHTFPPNIYYKIFTHRTVVDMCANSPKDYTKAVTKQLMARQCHNKGYHNTSEGTREGWYQRYENNGWRLVSERILRKIDQDAITYDSAQKKIDFKHCKLQRRKDLEQKRKRRKIEWMKKMYSEGILLTKRGTESPVVKDIETSMNGLVQVTDKKGYEAVDEWEVDELLEWTNGLNFDSYVSTWKEYATSAVSGPVSEKQKFFRDDLMSVTYTR
ncbi:uncharacterized protein C11orf65-like [Dendronephthya gigantea]|uniref:uncharacterized protein C11orf65-like n=1 Tax=Dendronephthya gigantea TaxID=151771 RepID=UPI001069D54D|nr:uncharacterized protein C11orf65-like [Dendronephthya gigantea]